MGWILTGKSMHHDTTTLARYVPDLAKDKFHVWITKYHYVPMIVLGRRFVCHRRPAVPAVGSFPAHRGRPARHLAGELGHAQLGHRAAFATRDLSTNSWWVALLTFGEGWHNNHHAHPVSARHGLKWYEIDLNWYGIWALKKLGLARNVYRVKLSELREQEPEEEKLAPAQPSWFPSKRVGRTGVVCGCRHSCPTLSDL